MGDRHAIRWWVSDGEFWRGKDHGFLEKEEEGSPANRRVLSQSTEARMWMSLGDCEESAGILERNAIKQVGPDFEDAQVSLSSLCSLTEKLWTPLNAQVLSNEHVS